MNILDNISSKKDIALKIFLPNVFKAIENSLLHFINIDNKFNFSLDGVNYDSTDITIDTLKIFSYILFIDIINEKNEENIIGIKRFIYDCYINLLIEKNISIENMSIENIIFYFDNIWISDNHLINFLEEYVGIHIDTRKIHLQYRLLINIHNLYKKYNTFLNNLYNINNNIFSKKIENRLIESDFNEFIEKKKNKHAANLLLSFKDII